MVAHAASGFSPIPTPLLLLVIVAVLTSDPEVFLTPLSMQESQPLLLLTRFPEILEFRGSQKGSGQSSPSGSPLCGQASWTDGQADQPFSFSDCKINTCLLGTSLVVQWLGHRLPI